MPVKRMQKTRDFTIITNAILQNREMSLPAAGLLCKALSLGTDWHIHRKGLANLSADGNSAAFRLALNELMYMGHVAGEDGPLTVYEEPCAEAAEAYRQKVARDNETQKEHLLREAAQRRRPGGFLTEGKAAPPPPEVESIFKNLKKIS